MSTTGGITVVVDVQVGAGADALINSFVAGLQDPTELNEMVSRQAYSVVRDHLLALGDSRHKTAQALGANPTGHWYEAAQKTSASHTRDAATVTINAPGISRAVRDVTIVPTGGKKWLTIPIHPLAYGSTAYGVEARIGAQLHFVSNKSGAAVLGAKPEGQNFFVAYFLLVKSAFQKQDRSLLPSDDELGQAALIGTRNYVDALLAAKGVAV